MPSAARRPIAVHISQRPKLDYIRYALHACLHLTLPHQVDDGRDHDEDKDDAEVNLLVVVPLDVVRVGLCGRLGLEEAGLGKVLESVRVRLRLVGGGGERRTMRESERGESVRYGIALGRGMHVVRGRGELTKAS